MKILLACGGTGGHVFPAFAVAEELRRRRPKVEILYACGTKDIESALFKIVSRERIFPVEAMPFRGCSSLVSFSFYWKLLKGLIQALLLLRRENPNLVIGFGGHFSFPVVLAAKLLNKKTLIHEQNAVPGMANLVLAKFVDGVAMSFPEVRAAWNGSRARFKVTGNPIRSSIEKASREDAMRFFGFSHARRTLLVLGGSQGSQSINAIFLQTLPELPAALRDRLQVLHLCGKMSVAEAESAFVAASVPGRAYSFFERMDLVYAVSDFAIGRAGATFLAEIASKKIPAILIPYPYGNGHQIENARVFVENHESHMIRQENFTTSSLKEILVREWDALRKSTLSAPAIDKSGARERLADFIEEIVNL